MEGINQLLWNPLTARGVVLSWLMLLQHGIGCGDFGGKPQAGST